MTDRNSRHKQLLETFADQLCIEVWNIQFAMTQIDAKDVKQRERLQHALNEKVEKLVRVERKLIHRHSR